MTIVEVETAEAVTVVEVAREAAVMEAVAAVTKRKMMAWSRRSSSSTDAPRW